MTEARLTNCEQEPIHIPGKIQGHGFLIATDRNFNVSHCSENIEKFLQLPANEVLGRSLNGLPGILNYAGEAVDLIGLIKVLSQQQKSTGTIFFDQQVHGKAFNVGLNVTPEGYVLDFEPEISDLKTDIQSLVGRSLSEMLADKDFQNVLRNAARQVKEIIGYDRVMIYKFHEDGHGEVVAESRNEELESWLGLHYPASDIPVQARELYKLNLVRLIADVHESPAALLALASAGTQPLNLTYSSLRAVSPIHIQYLINMGVASSFSISIVDQEKLWGLIACHSYTPRFINLSQRESAKLVGQVLSSAISFREQDQGQKVIAQHRQAIETITRYLLRNIAVEEALTKQPEHTLMDVLDCGGAAFYFENNLQVLGNTPDEQFILKLIQWLDEKTHDSGYYYTSRLSADFPASEEYKDSASGLLACRMGKELNEYMLWFRPEVMSTVKWAGEPVKVERIDRDGILHISPRNSFSEWREQVRLSSATWQNHELEAAMSLRDEVNYSISRKANELRVINEKLRLAYAELDTFSYTISHDLKNPLTTIKSYSELICRAGMSPDRIRSMAGRITAGAVKMQGMIDEVLQYSRVGQSKIQAKAINMQKMLDDLRQDLLIASENPNLVIQINETPEVVGDEMMVFQVFSNIVGNAVKYSSKVDSPKVVVSGEFQDDEVVYTISDNGIGIPEEQHASIFELFSRATQSDGFEGTGVGLSIVKRILEKHDGRVWLENKPDAGTNFFVSFNRKIAITTLN